MSDEEPDQEMDQATKALWLMAFKRQQLQHRRQQLQHRRDIMLKAQKFSSAPPEESVNLAELEAVEADIREIVKRQEALLKSGKLQKDPYDVQLFGESIYPEPDYEVPEELIPEPDYQVPEELIPEPSPEEPSLEVPDTDDNPPEEPSSEEPDNNPPEEPSPEAEPEETVRPYEPPESTVVVPPDKLVREPGWVTCSSCSQVVHTVIKHKVTDSTWIFCATLSAVGCVFGCCLIPFCLKQLKDVSHHCPNCNAEIHSVSRL